MQYDYWGDNLLQGSLLPILENTADAHLLNTLVYLVVDIDCTEIPDLSRQAFRQQCRDATRLLSKEGVVLPDDLRRRINRQAREVGIPSLT